MINFILFVMIGLSSWMLVNGLFVELPILMDVLPEHGRVPAYISLLVQTANLFPLAYIALLSSASRANIKRRDSLSMIILASCAILVAIFGSFAWQWTVADASVSLGLFSFTFLSGGVGAMSTVLYFPFASRFGVDYTSAISTGMGLTALWASVLGIIQNPGPDARFSVSLYFALLAVSMVFSLGALLYVLYAGRAPNENNDDDTRSLTWSSDEEREESGEIVVDRALLIDESSVVDGDRAQLTMACSMNDGDGDGDGDVLIDASVPTWCAVKQTMLPLLNQFWVNSMMYFSKGLITYSVLSYAAAPTFVLWLTVTGMIGDTCGRLATRFVRVFHLFAMSCAQTLVWTFLIVASTAGATEPLLPAPWGGWFVVAANALYSFLFGYEDTVIYQLVPVKLVRGNAELIHRVSRFIAIANQAGAFTGAILAFALTMSMSRFH
jgi:Solute carrier family 52, riboflavin transporter